MAVEEANLLLAERIIQEKLKPFVRKIDAEAHYPSEYLSAVGSSGLLRSEGLPQTDVLLGDVKLIEVTARTCMTAGFNLWCHLAASTYVRNTANPYLRNTLLPQFEDGTLMGGTGLSNPMKYYAGLEELHLKARRVETGYVVSGQLPMVSNLGPDHWFGFVASLEDRDQRVMAVVPCSAEGLTMKEKIGYLGLNGSATYSCVFDGVFIPDDWVVAEHADSFVAKIRPVFVLYQIPLGLGITESCIRSMEKAGLKQGGCSRYLSIQPEELAAELEALRERTYALCNVSDPAEHWRELLEIRLSVAQTTLKAVQGDMLHHGGAAYLQTSHSSRRLREAYFLANLTPTVRHLEKLLRRRK
jgi:alkylation response protein AidB-like acyl-CoA dehydrogenase